MTRRCSHCSTNGHNSRTCPNRGVKLFGVRITDGSIRKCASMGNLTHYTGSTSGGGAGGYNHLNGGGAAENLDSPGAGGDNNDHGVDVADGYASEDFVPGSSSSRERKKGVPWTEEEHKMFLVGLQKLGKGDWRGIARKYVISRTPTQVASHAQKYFIRQSNSSRRKRRSSLFDMVADDSAETPMPSHEVHVVNPSQAETSNHNNNNSNNNNNNDNNNNDNIKDNNTLLAINTFEEESESMESTVPEDPPQPIPTPNPVASVAPQFCYPVVFPTYMPPFIPVAVPYWPGCNMKPFQVETHQVLKPTAVHSKNPIPVDGLMSMSKLSLAEPVQNGEPIPRTLNLVGGLGRQSAFHAKSSAGSPSHSPIHAV